MDLTPFQKAVQILEAASQPEDLKQKYLFLCQQTQESSFLLEITKVYKSLLIKFCT